MEKIKRSVVSVDQLGKLMRAVSGMRVKFCIIWQGLRLLGVGICWDSLNDTLKICAFHHMYIIWISKDRGWGSSMQILIISWWYIGLAKVCSSFSVRCYEKPSKLFPQPKILTYLEGNTMTTIKWNKNNTDWRTKGWIKEGQNGNSRI